MLKNGGSPERLLALKVIDGAHRDVVAICGGRADKEFQPGVTTTKQEIEEEKSCLIDWLLDSAFTEGSFEYWAGIADLSASDIEIYRTKLLDMLDEHDLECR